LEVIVVKKRTRSRVHEGSANLTAYAEPNVATEKEDRIIQQALSILEARCSPGEPLLSPADVARYLRLKLGQLRNECFAVLYLNTRNEFLAFNEHFHGTVDGASVYPRVIVQMALEVNASTVILAHNHPSGVAEPSEADRQITRKLAQALRLVDVRVLDHIVVSARGVVSFAERGLLY
jgi:DNA repair protein RadC